MRVKRDALLIGDQDSVSRGFHRYFQRRVQVEYLPIKSFSKEDPNASNRSKTLRIHAPQAIGSIKGKTFSMGFQQYRFSERHFLAGGT